MAQSRNAFRLTRWILLKLPALFNLFAKFRNPQKRILLIKTDAIGDYILFRNFIGVLKNNGRYQGYEITLLGNGLWKDIARKYDGDFIHEFIFSNVENLYHSPGEVLKLGWKLFKANYEIVLQPAYSRTLMIDGLAGLAAAKHTIGFESDTERIREKYKCKTDKLYTERLLLPTAIVFEFERNQFFFESILKETIALNSPSLPVIEKERKGIVLIPSAGIAKRRWQPGQFVELIKLIAENTAETIYLEGSPIGEALETALSDYIQQGRIINLIGKTSLIELIDLVSSAKLVIANETGPVHIAAATQTRAVCILGGGHFGRFSPYPEHMQNGPVCVYHPMECYSCNWVCIYKTTTDEPYPCVSNVTLDAVWDEVRKHL